MTQKSKPEASETTTSATSETKGQAPTASKETAREAAMRLSLSNPKIKIIEPSGKGFVIVGAKRPSSDK